MKRTLYALVFFTASLVTITTPRANPGELALARRWAVEIGKNHGGSPVLYPDASSPSEIVVGTPDGRILRIGPEGQVRHVYEMGGATNCSPAVGDLDGDGVAEIVSATASGQICCFAPDGERRWVYDAHSRIDYTLSLADLDGDGKLEVLATAKDGWVHCIRAEGERLWRFQAEPQCGPVAVGDLNGDHLPEVVFGSDLGRIFCLDRSGRYLWHVELDGHFGRSLPLLVDVDGDGRTEVFITRSEVCNNAAVIAIDGPSGRVLWQAPTTMHGYGPLAVTDVDGDGELDILDVDKSTSVYCFDPHGRRKWSRSLLGRGIFYPPAVADLDGDGRQELVVGIRGRDKFVLLNDQGEVLQDVPLRGGSNCSPTVADLDRDGALEIYMLSQNPGELVQYEVEKPRKSGRVGWATWRGDSKRTGYVRPPKAVPAKPTPMVSAKSGPVVGGHISAFLGENVLPVRLEELGTREGLVLQTRLSSPQGSSVTTLDFLPKPAGSVARVLFSLRDPGPHALEVEVLGSASKTSLKRWAYTVSVDSFAADLAFLADRAHALDTLLTLLPRDKVADANLLVGEKNAIRAQTDFLRERAAQFPSMSPAQRSQFVALVEAKRQGFQRRLRLLRFVVQQRRSGVSEPFVCWEDPNPWDDVPAEQILPTTGDLRNPALHVLALGRETESRALYLTNLTDQPLYIKVLPVSWRDEQGHVVGARDVLELREAIPVGTARGSVVWDALPRLNEGQVVVLPALGHRQLWLTFRTHSLKSGVYRASLRLLGLALNDPAVTVRLELEVSTVSLPMKSALAFCTWPHIGQDPEDPVAARRFEDLLCHGETVFLQSPPPQRFDAHGKLLAEVDWSRHDAWMRKYLGKGIVLILSFQNSLRGPEGVPKWSKTWQAAYKAALLRYVAHLKSLGFGYADFALYPVDEPWLTGMAGVQELLRCARLAKEVDPEVQIYCDPAGMPSPENSAEAVPYVDIWAPQLDLLKRDKKLLKFYRNTGAAVWSYEAPGAAKLLKPLGLYRMQPWLAFRYGLSGCGMWTYNYGNIWFSKQPAPFLESYGLVFDDGQTVVSSRRWEAYRDGVEDFNLLTLVKREVDKQPARFARLRTLLEEAVTELTAGQEQAQSINRLVMEYDPDYRQLVRYRAELIRALEKLRAFEK